MEQRSSGSGTIGVVGAGTMGAGIAQVALEAGERVIIHDPEPGAMARARARIADGLVRRRRRISSAGGDAADPDEPLDRLVEGPDLGALAGSALVIEAVVEDLDVKRSVFGRLDAIVADDAILATNTSALGVTAIGAATRHPDRVIGLHFFNPAPLMALVEVVAPATADPGIVERATDRVTRWGKTTVRTADTPGFIVNRVNRPFTLEALALLETGVGSVASIDGAVRAAGFPMGPFELMDLVGIDVNLAAAQAIFAGTSYEPRFRPSLIQERLVEAGRLGRKTGEGFYWYGDDGRRLAVAGAFATEDAGADADASDEIVDRIVLAVIDEAYRALGDRVASAGDIDLALRLGAGHPRGPFAWAAELGGAAAVLDGLDRWRAAGLRFEPAAALVAAAGRSP